MEKIINSGSKVLPKQFTDTLSQYEAFLKLPFRLSTDKITDVIGIIHSVYKNILKIPKINTWVSTGNRRFLMHLIGHHYYVSQIKTTNQFFHISLMYQYFNFSCAPNVTKLPFEGQVVYFTVRPIEKGTPLQLAYQMIDITVAKMERQRSIWDQEKIICTCMRCTDGEELTSPMQRHQMISDPDFQYVVHSPLEIDQFLQIQKILNVKCISFLEKYRKITWCQEIGIVFNTYIQIIQALLVTNDLTFMNLSK